jgi:GT2 family glycosyltransferase
MRCSVIIPTFNRKDSLRACLAAVTRQDHPDYEVVVVDDASTDGTGEIVGREFPPVRYLRQDMNGGQVRARNRAISVATGDLLAFTDDDCVPEPGWLRLHAAHYADPRVGAVGGPQIPRSLSFYDKFFIAHYAEEYRGQHRIERITAWERLVSGNMSVPRAVLQRLGVFDERFLSGSDADLVRRICRAGYVVISDAELGVEHLKAYTLRTFLQERFRKASGSLMTDVKEGTLRARRFLPLPNLAVSAQAWRSFREMFGGGARACAAFWALALGNRMVEVGGRAYYYWTLARAHRR